MKLLRFSVLTAALFAAGPAITQTVYRCTDANGRNVYQQTACTGAQAQRAYREARAPLPSTQQAFQFQGQEAQPSQQPQTYYAPQSSRAASAHRSLNPLSADAERLRRAQYAARSMRGSPSARAAVVSGIMGQPAPPPINYSPAPPNPDDGIGQPTTVIDSRTGAPINGTNGVILVAPNRVWNPRTGEYIDTFP